VGCSLVCVALLASRAPAATAASSQPGAPCANPTVSAVNQYCEDIPSASGPRASGPGAPILASSLPRRAAQRLAGAAAGAPAGRVAPREARKARAHVALLSLPAPGARVPLSGSPATNDASPFSWLIAVLAGVALALAAAAIVRRRRLAA
jgi:hypothetical protein